MDGNQSYIRFAGVQLPMWSYYSSINPLEVDGHYDVIIKSVLEKFNWNYEGETFMIKGEVTGDGLLGSLAKNFEELMTWLTGVRAKDILIRFSRLRSRLRLRIVISALSFLAPSPSKSDVSFCSTVPEYETFRYVDYSHVMYEPKIFIVSTEATATFESSAFAFLAVYSSRVWLTWFAFAFLTALFWSFAENALRPSQGHRVFSRNQGLTRKFFDTYGIIFNQGVNMPPSRFGHLRLALCCWIMACFVLGAGFTGVLLSKLTLPPEPRYIETLRDILKHPSLRLQIFEDSTIRRILKESTNAVQRRVWERVVRSESEINLINWDPDDTSKKMSLGKMITFLEEQEILEVWPVIFDPDFLRSLHISPRIDLTIQNAFPMRKGLDPGKARLFRETVQSLFEGHIIWQSFRLEFWKNRLFFVKDPILPKKLDPSSIRIVSSGLLLGFLFSIVSFIFELNRQADVRAADKRRLKRLNFP